MAETKNISRHGYRPPFDKSKIKGPNGRKLCRYCGTEVPEGRRLWCSEECVDEVSIRKGDTVVIRRAVWDRDNGICQGCGLDIKTIIELGGFLTHPLHFLADIGYPKFEGEYYWDSPEFIKWNRGREKFMDKRHETWKGFAWRESIWREFCKTELDIDIGCHEHYWEADHIIPVSEGGGGLGLDNFQVLCIQCHKKDTRKLHKRLARKRDPQARLFTMGEGE